MASDPTELERQRLRVERRLSAQYAVTRTLSEASDLPAAARKVLEALCSALGWRFGALWMLDDQSKTLRCIEVWDTSAMQPGRFATETRQRVFDLGNGLPGRVWGSGTSVWIPDVGKEPT